MEVENKLWISVPFFSTVITGFSGSRVKIGGRGLVGAVESLIHGLHGPLRGYCKSVCRPGTRCKRRQGSQAGIC